MTSSRYKVLPIPLRCLKVIVLKSLQKDDSNDIYFSLSSFCSSPAVKSSMLSVEVSRQPKSNLSPPPLIKLLR